jgi:hypothetical protein
VETCVGDSLKNSILTLLCPACTSFPEANVHAVVESILHTLTTCLNEHSLRSESRRYRKFFLLCSLHWLHTIFQSVSSLALVSKKNLDFREHH